MSLSLKKSPAGAQSKSQPIKKEVRLFIAGIGAVGGSLAQQILDLEHPLYNVSVAGACNSTYTQWNPDVHAIAEEHTLGDGESTNWDSLPNTLIKNSRGNLIFVDATGSEIAARQYAHLLKNGVHVVTPSKRANTFGQDYFNQLLHANNTNMAQYRYETAVGAGLPVISTIKTLLNSGDEITKISGVASGTMTYLFTQLQNGVPFSQAVRKAKEEGYSEPDPRDDLAGEDVARKFLILARTSGYRFERSQVQVETLVPTTLMSLSTEAFLDKLPEYDEHWQSRNTQAFVNNRKLRYTGTFTPKEIQVGIEEVSTDSPLGGLKGTDNLLQIYTKRYAQSPVVIQGPGAGKAVTAAGVLGDVIDIADFL